MLDRLYSGKTENVHMRRLKTFIEPVGEMKKRISFGPTPAEPEAVEFGDRRESQLRH